MTLRLAAPIAIAIALISACTTGEPLRAGEHKYDRVRIGPGDMVDGATTLYALSKPGIEEANPLLAPFGEAAGIAAIPVKYGAKQLVVKAGATPASANVGIESAGMGAGCSNLVTITGGAPAVGIATGIVCAIVTYNHMSNKYERETGRKLNEGYRPPITVYPAKTGADGKVVARPTLVVHPVDSGRAPELVIPKAE